MESKRTSPAEPVTELRRVPIVECGEELVDFLALCPELLLDQPRFRYRRETLLRRTVAVRLCRANSLLPDGRRIAVVEGWRPPYIQRRMYRTFWDVVAAEHPQWGVAQLRRYVNRFTAPMHDRVPPPHTTGGAVDLVLVDSLGLPVDVVSPFDPQDRRAFSFAAPGLSPEARANRDTLAAALTGAGITNYPSEYWHWSYGDQGWAYRGGHPHALYGAVTPPGWSPSPEDAIDAPLEWID